MNNFPQTSTTNPTNDQNKSTHTNKAPFIRIQVPAAMKPPRYRNMKGSDVNPEGVSASSIECGHQNYPHRTMSRDRTVKPYMSQPMFGVGSESDHGEDEAKEGRVSLDVIGSGYENSSDLEAGNQVVPEPRVRAQPCLASNETKRQRRPFELPTTASNNRPHGFKTFSRNSKKTSSSNSISNAIWNGTQAGFAIIGFGVGKGAGARRRASTGDVGNADETTPARSNEVGPSPEVSQPMASTSSSISASTTNLNKRPMTDNRTECDKTSDLRFGSFTFPRRHELSESGAREGKGGPPAYSVLTAKAVPCTEPTPSDWSPALQTVEVRSSGIVADVIVKSDNKPDSISRPRALPALASGEVLRSTRSASRHGRDTPGHTEFNEWESTKTSSMPTYANVGVHSGPGSFKMGGPNDKVNGSGLRTTRTLVDDKDLVANTPCAVLGGAPAIYVADNKATATTRTMQHTTNGIPSDGNSWTQTVVDKPASISNLTQTSMSLCPPPTRRTLTSIPTSSKPPRLSLSAVDRRLSFHGLLEGSARLSPSIIIRPPPLPLLNLPVLVTPGGSRTNVEEEADNENKQSGLMSIPALPLQGSSRGTRGHEEEDDLEEGDEEDEEEGATPEISPGNSEHTGKSRSSCSSEKSTDDEDCGVVVDNDGRDIADKLSVLTSRSSSYETARADFSPTTSESFHENLSRPLDNRRSSRTSSCLPQVDTPELAGDVSPSLLGWDSYGMSRSRSPAAQRRSHGNVDMKGKSKQREDNLNEDILPHARNIGWDPQASNRQNHDGDDGYGRGCRGVVVFSNGSKVVAPIFSSNDDDHSRHNSIPPVLGRSTSASSTGTTITGSPASRTSLSFVTLQRDGMGTKVADGSQFESSHYRAPLQSRQGKASSPTMNTSGGGLSKTLTSDNRSRMPSSPGSGYVPLRPPLIRSSAPKSGSGGGITQNPGMYKRASQSLIDVRSIEKKEMVEKMMRDQEEEEETRRRSRRVSKMSVRVSGVHEGTRNLSREPSDQQSVRESFRSAEEMLGEEGEDQNGELAISEDNKATNMTTSGPISEALHPLRRRRSMPTTDPPPYSGLARHISSFRFKPTVQPPEDEGMEKLPSYSNEIHLRAIMPRKMEFNAPGVLAKDRKWRRVLCVLEGTVFKVYKCPVGAGGVSAIGEWWESKVGASPEQSSHLVNYGNGLGSSRLGSQMQEDNSFDRAGEMLRREIELARARKNGEGGETGQPVLQRSNVVSPVQPQSQPVQRKALGHHSNHSLGVMPTTKSALTFAVQLLKPGTRHKRSNSDVPPRSPQCQSPRPSFNLPRSSSGRTTPTTIGNHGIDSMRSHSPSTASTHHTMPGSSSAVFGRLSRPSTPTSSLASSSAHSRSTFRPGSSSDPSNSRQTGGHTNAKGKGKRDVLLEPDENDLIRAYTMQRAESGLGKDYTKRPHVIRVRLEGEQFLLQTKNVESVIGWIEGLQAAANVALDLDERPMPAGPVIPRRRRRRRRTAAATVDI